MMSTINPIKWKKLASLPHTYSQIPTGINRNQYIILDSVTGNICMYDFNNDKWNTIICSNITCCQDFATTVDTTNKILYICHPNGTKTDINLTNKSITTTASHLDIGDDTAAIAIQNQLHIIGGDHNNKHLKWNPITSQFDTLHTFDTTVSAAGSLVYLQSQKSLFYLGGYDHSKHTHIDNIYQYHIPSNKWNKLTLKMPIALGVFGVTKAIREQYILIFGGYNVDGDHDEIFVFNVLTGTMRKSEVKCPLKSAYKAVTINDYDRDEKLVHGFIRSEWLLSQVPLHLYPPLYLLQLMSSFYLNEDVHLFDWRTVDHWKMSTLEIVKRTI